MSLPPLLIQSVGSLVAILALAALSYWMKLGGTPTLADEATLHRAVEEIADGSAVAHSAISRDGASALVRDSEGRIILIRRHGNRFAGRVLTAQAAAQANGNVLYVDCGERRFGNTRLELDEARAWENSINQLNRTRHV